MKRHFLAFSWFLAFLFVTAACESFIGEPVLVGSVDVSEGQGPAVVFIKGLEGEVPTQDTVITHTPEGTFAPRVSIGFVGSDFVLRNEDDELHTTHLTMHLAYQRELSGRPIQNGATLYNIAFPSKDMEVRRPIKPYHHFDEETGFIEVRCNPHPEETASALVFDHPYVVVTDESGGFEMANVPPGTHELWVWQAGEARKWQDVDVKQRGATKVAGGY